MMSATRGGGEVGGGANFTKNDLCLSQILTTYELGLAIYVSLSEQECKEKL